MAAHLRVVYSYSVPEDEESFDLQELASQAAEALEAYRRAPWTGINDRIRTAKLRLAKHLLDRIEGLETGRIPMRIWGD
jgi:hypothetical protein